MERIQLMNIARQHQEHAAEYEAAALRVLRSGTYIGGEEVAAFESEFAAHAGARHAISCGNGTEALTIALEGLGVGAGDEVITVGFTFFATAEAIAAVGATPVFIDVLEDTYCMDPSKIECAVTPRTKALLPVHLYGHAADMDAINAVAKKHSLYVVEDCAQAAGTTYKDKPIGALGDAGCFSFFPTKTLGCDGDGGMIVTNSEALAHACRSIKVHGSGLDGLETLKAQYARRRLELPANMPIGADKYHNYLIGRNSRLDAVQAAILRVKLGYLDDFIERRRANAKFYNAALQGSGYAVPYEAGYTRHTYYVYVLRHMEAKRIMAHLNRQGIPCGTYYPVPMHLQGAFATLGGKKGDLPVSERLCDTTFAIPVYPELRKDERDTVIDALLRAEQL